ncbi:LacI family DNA-binding transcriptional regulator [Clostridium sp. AM58-1XD]|uniref:LacI family DNA-binding transcriptional regulator n=1 Tax=Clostridium sp. AM58-1XD TaxID=2292307 RepID=UPI000E4D0ECF|nr:LacI family DNA-binding transcriptional regulator [Clostridium sp. AM58-1XD]RGY96445.1 LacI family transcriptional regulator [Clostridium sp. AM58-1XD]
MTIKEIAKLAGVSNAAVSRYLNNGYVSEEKRKAIREVIEKTGFVPSAHAQMLRSRKTKLIGVILPKINSDSTSRTVAGISRVLSEDGFQILLADTENQAEKELEYLNLFQNHQVDGIILIATFLTKRHRELLKNAPVPVVVIGQESKEVSCVYNNDFEAAKSVAELLIKRGRKKIGCLSVTNKDKAAGQERFRGFLAAVREGGLDEKTDVFCEECGFAIADGKKGAERILADHPETDALFCATDAIAIGAMEAIREAGKRIPDDISIVGIGNTELSRICSPKLTTAHYYFMTRGMEAAKLMLELLEGEGTPEGGQTGDGSEDSGKVIKRIQLGFSVKERESV